MRFGVIAENLIERLVLKFNAAPEPLAETQLAYSMARSVMVGAKLGMFEAGVCRQALGVIMLSGQIDSVNIDQVNYDVAGWLTAPDKRGNRRSGYSTELCRFGDL